MTENTLSLDDKRLVAKAVALVEALECSSSVFGTVPTVRDSARLSARAAVLAALITQDAQ